MPRRAQGTAGGWGGPIARSFLLVTAVKLLLVPCYKSTDFEVHRNWLAVTGTLPLARWYTEATSQWTLDYPPLFGWFERGLALFAPLADRGMLTLQADPYDTPNTVLFQRCTVMLGDVVLVIGVLWQTSGAFNGGGGGGVTPRGLALLLVVFSPGLLMVDHVHFQYNGMMLGLQLCALAAVGHGYPVLGAVLFSALLHMKHIFVYAAPALAAHLLVRERERGREKGRESCFVLFRRLLFHSSPVTLARRLRFVVCVVSRRCASPTDGSVVAC